MHPCPAFFNVDFQYFLEVFADVNDNATSHHLARNGSAACSWDKMGFALTSCFNQVDNILFVFGEGHALRYLTISRSIGGVSDAMERVGVDGEHLGLFVQLAEYAVVALEFRHDDFHLSHNLHRVAGLEFVV